MLNPYDSATATYNRIAGTLEGIMKEIAQLPDTLSPVTESKSGPPALGAPLIDHLRDALKPTLELQKGLLTPDYRCVFVGQPRSGVLPFVGALL